MALILVSDFVPVVKLINLLKSFMRGGGRGGGGLISPCCEHTKINIDRLIAAAARTYFIHGGHEHAAHPAEEKEEPD